MITKELVELLYTIVESLGLTLIHIGAALSKYCHVELSIVEHIQMRFHGLQVERDHRERMAIGTARKHFRDLASSRILPAENDRIRPFPSNR